MLFLLCFSFQLPFFSSKTKARVQESTKDRLKRLYKDHKVMSYATARTHMYNDIDCADGEIFLIYGGSTYPWKCGGTKKPSATDVNCEHLIPQSTFGKKSPMVSDVNHLFPAPAKLNSVRSNYKFAEVDYSECAQFCKDDSCSTSKPSNPDEYSCLTKSKEWMPRKDDRGRIARAIFYFYTMYDDYHISTVGDVETFKDWNKKYAPDAIEKARNEAVNKTQGNRNPYIDDPSLVDEVF